MSDFDQETERILMSNGERYTQAQIVSGIFDRLVLLRSQVNFLLALTARDLVKRRGTDVQRRKYDDWEREALKEIMLKIEPDEDKEHDIHLPT